MAGDEAPEEPWGAGRSGKSLNELDLKGSNKLLKDFKQERGVLIFVLLEKSL